MTIQINYLDKHGTILASYDTGDDSCDDALKEWADWLEDSSVSHPGAPDAWAEYDLVDSDQ